MEKREGEREDEGKKRRDGEGDSETGWGEKGDERMGE